MFRLTTESVRQLCFSSPEFCEKMYYSVDLWLYKLKLCFCVNVATGVVQVPSPPNTSVMDMLSIPPIKS